MTIWVSRTGATALVALLSFGACGGEEPSQEISNEGISDDGGPLPDGWAPGHGRDSTTGNDGSTPTAVDGTPFRVTSMHLHYPVPHFIVSIASRVNDMITDHITGDVEPEDGFLDISFLQVFRPLDPAASSGVSDLMVADCLPPAADTECVPKAGESPTRVTLENLPGDCIEVLEGTTTKRVDIPLPEGACFRTEETTLDLQLGRLPVHLENARVAADYDGDEPTRLVRGVIRGFMSREVAENTILPASITLVGGRPLADILRDREATEGPDGSEGWWFYLTFEADPVPLTE